MPQLAWNPTICVGLPYRLAMTTMMRPQLIVWWGLGYVRRALLIGILFEKKIAIPRHLEGRQGFVAEAQKGPAPPFTQYPILTRDSFGSWGGCDVVVCFS